ncbi:MAG: phospholipase [Alphaproteobacteria bacterium]|nr:phospholipase [Alphaproteobacteria bacterium]MCB9791522.1 phospholipase [Alphaproteobacteria bacterium]
MSLLTGACAEAPAEPSPPPTRVTLVESNPAGTDLDDPDLAEASAHWSALIEGARSRVDVEQFYISSAPGTEVEALLQALVDAGARGLSVRILVDKKLSETYPETLQRLAEAEGVSLRIWDYAGTFGAGVQHAKLLLVDGERAYMGSHNLDWRALTHIQELGAILEGEALVRPYAEVFEMDWALAGGAAPPPAAPHSPPETGTLGPLSETLPVFSPQGALPEGATWDLPWLLSLIDGAETRVRVQLLSYATVGYDGDYFDALDRALRRANARGVPVQLLVSDWAKSPHNLHDLTSLAALEHVEVRFVVIPQPEDDFIPFGRVAHAKFMVVDGARAWLGSSNWSGDYFYSSRNVGLVTPDPALVQALDRRFERTWGSRYAEPLVLGQAYAAPPRTEGEE